MLLGNHNLVFTNLEEIFCDDAQSPGVVSHSLEVLVVNQHPFKDLQEEVQRVLVQEVDLEAKERESIISTHYTSNNVTTLCSFAIEYNCLSTLLPDLHFSFPSPPISPPLGFLCPPSFPPLPTHMYANIKRTK